MKLHHSPSLVLAASLVVNTCHTVHGCRPTSVAIQPHSSASTASGPATTATRRNHRWASRSRRRQRSTQNTTTSSASAVPTATIVWKARWVMLTGGCSSAGTVSSPGIGAVSELRAMIDPSRGISSAPRT
ncbi:Uncharacterised protein [Mycobacteroides abscessus subsp. abscessus]|nr:Uncharacterised protein [Mycobacteroides abscessus subsp. abscessus]